MQSNITVKVTYEGDIRRFTIDSISWKKIQVTLERLYPTISWSNCQITYQDDESDWVSISTDEELQEAISQLNKKKSILRLTLKQKNSSMGQGRCGRRNHIGKKSEDGLKNWNGRCGGWWGWRRNFQPESMQRRESEPCENGMRLDWGGRCGWRRNHFQFAKLHHEAICLMKSGKKEDLLAAKALLIEQMQLKPNHRIPVYNMACNEALLGNIDSAFEYLEKSISLGFRNAEHIENDKDLESLRQDKRYQEIINKLKQDSEELNEKYFQRIKKAMLHHKIMRLFDAGTKESLESAKLLLFRQASFDESDPIPQYNLACVEALLGNTKEALVYLERALSLGYKDLEHILSDNDLISIRQLPEFQKIISVLQPEKEKPQELPVVQEKLVEIKQEPIVQEKLVEIKKPIVQEKLVEIKPIQNKIQVEEKSSEVPPDPLVVEHAENLQLLSEMGFNDQNENLSVLVLVNGNLEAALSQLLN